MRRAAILLGAAFLAAFLAAAGGAQAAAPSCRQMRAWLHVIVQPGEGVGDLPVRWMLRT